MSNDTTNEHKEQAKTLMTAYHAEATDDLSWGMQVRGLPSFQAMVEADPLTQIELLHLVLAHLLGTSMNHAKGRRLHAIGRALFAKELPFSSRSLCLLLRPTLESHSFYGGDRVASLEETSRAVFIDPILGATVKYVKSHGWSEELRDVLVPQLQVLRRSRHDPALHLMVNRLMETAGLMREGDLETVEPWAATITSDVDAMTEEIRTNWLALFFLSSQNEGSKPTARFFKQATPRIEAIGHDAFARQLAAWFPLLTATATATTVLSERNSLILRGSVWLSTPYEDVALARALGGLAEAMYRKIGGSGFRSRKVATACLTTLSEMPGTEPLYQLGRLGQRLKGPQAQGDVGKAIETAARRAGLTREALEELVVPAFGLEAGGVLREMFGDYIAEITITGTTDTEWRWLAPNGKPQKSVPAAVKTDHAAELKELKATHDEIRKTLPAQRERLERLLRSDRDWSLAEWRMRYADHPLLAQMVRRLVWEFRQPDTSATLATFTNGQLVDVHEHPLDALPDETRVRLWHPITSDAQTVLAWRVWLEERGMSQPFKQAHREVYLLTDAELATVTYSNRFAAHILRQMQFFVLCQQRGWTYQREGWFDQSYDRKARQVLSEWGLTVEFWVEGVGEEQTETGWYVYIATDQVRFCDPDGTPRRLVDVPARVFTEVMRDVDLFVGVTSIGNDPEWQDGGRGGTERERTYWQGYAFGDLSASAATRRDVLARLLPRLKIAARCTLTDRLLLVRGDVRTYKIHLGSGNILMEPNDQYLCIVPARGGAAGAEMKFLPFEGDTMLAIILSKAFLLADDTKITDPTITRQITPG